MAYDIVCVQADDPPTPGERSRGVLENVFLSKLPTSPKVFAFFFPGSLDTDDLQERLRALGEKTSDNLCVHMGEALLSDPDYQRAAERFRLRTFPAVVVTAVNPLAATPEDGNAYVRLDSKALFANPQQLARTVEELFNLFLTHKISQAIRVGWTQEGKAALVASVERVWSVVQPVITWLSKKDFTLEFGPFKIAVEESRGH
jgi:hypothetical protein